MDLKEVGCGGLVSGVTRSRQRLSHVYSRHQTLKGPSSRYLLLWFLVPIKASKSLSIEYLDLRETLDPDTYLRLRIEGCVPQP